MEKKFIESVEKTALNPGELSETIKEFLVYQREYGMLDSTIEVLLSLIRFTREKKGSDISDVQEAVRDVLSKWINFRCVNKDEQIDIEEIMLIESNEKVIPEISREYWYRRLYGGAILAELGSFYSKEKNKNIVRFLGGIFFQITPGNPRNFGDLTNNRKFDHDPAAGDTANFYSVSTEESYRDYKFHLGSELVFSAADYIRKKYPNVKKFQTFSPFSIEKYAVDFLKGNANFLPPREALIDLFTLEEKNLLIQRVFEIHSELRQKKVKKTGNVFSYCLGYIKGEFDYIYEKISRWSSREKFFCDALAHAISVYSNRKNPVELKKAYFDDPIVRRIIRRTYQFLSPYYLQERNSRGRFLNPVQNFHMKNGAVPGEILLFGATEMDRKPIWGYTAGGLCCIRYVYPDTEEKRIENSRKYQQDLEEFRKSSKKK